MVYPSFLNKEEHWFGVIHKLPSVICVDTTLCCRKSRLNRESFSNPSNFRLPIIKRITVIIPTIASDTFLVWYLLSVIVISESKNSDVAIIKVVVILYRITISAPNILFRSKKNIYSVGYINVLRIYPTPK